MTTFVGTPIDNTSAEAKAAVRSHIRGSGLLLTGRVISLALTSLTQVLIVRHLSTDNYAAWAYAFSVVLLLQVLSSFGFQEAVPRFVSIYHERQDYPRMFGTMLLSVGLIALSSAVVIAAFFCFPDKLLALFHQQKESLVVLSVLIFMVPFEGFDGVLMGVFASLANPRSIFFRRYILAPSLRLAVVVLLIAGKASVSFLAYGYLASSVLGILIYTWILLRLLHREGLLADLRRNGVHVPYRELLSFVAPMMTSDLLLVLTDSGLALLIGYYCGLREAALFRIVIPLAALNHIVGNMTGILYMPAAARLFANNDRDGLGHLYWRTATWVAVLTFPVFVATFAFARPLTIALYGERYADAAVILAIMSAGSYFHAMWGKKSVRHHLSCQGMNGYSETLEYLYGLEKFGIVFGLDNIRWILSLLGNPQDALRTVHVAGTNGKGSVVSMLSEILRTAGYATGAYTSPHLISFTERITINGEAIREEDVVDLTRFIKGHIDREDSGRRFTFFDFTTALAFLYFKRKGVDIAVIEVGLGGRLDSTNVVHPLATVITNVAFDHQEYLGNTIDEIAREKAGVVKEHVPVVTGAEGASLDIIRAAAADTDLYALGKAFTYKKKGEQVMWYRGMHRTFDDLSVALRGDHQLFNAALALAAVELLGERGFNLNEYTVRKGLLSVRWPGRLEVVRKAGKPPVLIDGAHNPQGAHTLASYLKNHFLSRRRILVFGVMKDKDFKEMLRKLLPMVHRTILTRPETSRAAPPADMAEYAPGAVITQTVADAVDMAFKMAEEHDLIIVTGSFYTVGEAKKLLDEQP